MKKKWNGSRANPNPTRPTPLCLTARFTWYPKLVVRPLTSRPHGKRTPLAPLPSRTPECSPPSWNSSNLLRLLLLLLQVCMPAYASDLETLLLDCYCQGIVITNITSGYIHLRLPPVSSSPDVVLARLLIECYHQDQAPNPVVRPNQAQRLPLYTYRCQIFSLNEPRELGAINV